MIKKQWGNILKLFFISFIVSISLFTNSYTISAQTGDEQKKGLESQIQEYQQKLTDIRQQKNTLSTQIQEMDTQMYLTSLTIQRSEQKIIETQNEIEKLSSRIDNLDPSLNVLSKLLLRQIAKSYKTRSVSLVELLFETKNMNDLANKIKYLHSSQKNNQKLLIQVQEAKLSYEEQKVIREQKKQELDQLISSLNNQKRELKSQQVQKQKLLIDTNNDEATYQSLLTQAQAEYTAIQGIVSGAGTETKIRDVKKGDSIASIISGASCNSGGAHTHFIVKQNGVVMNPFNYLTQVSFTNCSGSSCGSDDGDIFNPSGSWEWPLNPTIELEQGFGSTWAVRNTWVGRIYGFHNGIDINGNSNDVLAVSDGTLYKGAYAVGCALSYVKLVHKDSNIETYYLHVYSK